MNNLQETRRCGSKAPPSSSPPHDAPRGAHRLLTQFKNISLHLRTVNSGAFHFCDILKLAKETDGKSNENVAGADIGCRRCGGTG